MKVKLKESFNLLLMKIYPDFSEITQIKMCLSSINHEDEKISLLYINITAEECTHALPVSDDHRSCQKLINYITNIKAKSKRYHLIQKIPVLKRLFIQNFCKRSRCLEENPVFLFLPKKKWKKEFSPSLQVVFSIVDRSQFEI